MSEGRSERYRPPEPNQMFTLGHDKWKRNGPSAHQSTAGAVEVRDAKGRVVGLEKVKVTRYMAGKRPDWAPDDFDSDEEIQIQPKNIKIKMTGATVLSEEAKQAASGEEGGTSEISNFEDSAAVAADPRLARLMRHQAEIKDDDEDDRRRVRHEPVIMSSEDEDEKEESDDEATEKRRELIRRRNLEREKQEAEILPLDDDLPDIQADDESSEYETEYESEEDEGPRLKPVFVREKDRLTVKNAEIEEAKQKRIEVEKKKLAARVAILDKK
ncbi:Oidioi.mRNA.OKI2018_I69.chr1.g2588.t1.cds [Oikopleura dioica]|uniref:Oidioi.mRNA.OKI2018_I69.chr1.g2588.t1.cds n=1 Tax=Oikopleura dioica TaxID=34765 RepID=A0ABN7SVF9_OIKDI|nr:Oidioi.mRNA.OKI2018_I69.chr1.g2588.t1.cds [Oikopleura dioica]